MKIHVIYPVISVLFFSCSHYIDSNISKNQNSIKTGLEVHKRYNVFKYNANYTFTRDSEVFHPRAFEIRLPKKMKYYTGINGTDFGFYYNNNQVIFVKIGVNNSLVNNDIMYEPSFRDLEGFIDDTLLTQRGKFDIKEIKPDPKNKNNLIKKGKATILLYNISKRDIDCFVSFANTFHFR